MHSFWMSTHDLPSGVGPKADRKRDIVEYRLLRALLNSAWGHNSMASVSRSTSASMPSASRSASVAAFLRRHILSVMGNPSRSARNAPNMRISIWSMVSTASTSPAWNRRSPSPSRSSRNEYRDSSRTGSFLRILAAGSPRQCMARRAKSRYDGSRIPARFMDIQAARSLSRPAQAKCSATIQASAPPTCVWLISSNSASSRTETIEVLRRYAARSSSNALSRMYAIGSSASLSTWTARNFALTGRPSASDCQPSSSRPNS